MNKLKLKKSNKVISFYINYYWGYKKKKNAPNRNIGFSKRK